MKYKLGDIVKVKEGVVDPDFEKFDISNWQGKIISDEDEFEDEKLFSIEWDNITLNQMPEEVLDLAELEGLKITEMVLSEDEIELAEERPQEPLVERVSNEISELEKRIAVIIGDNDLDVTLEKLETYQSYLLENLDFSTVITGIEDFSWEERYVFGYGDKDEYKRLKKTRPSYRDLYKIMKFEEFDEFVGLIVKVKRLSDRKIFELPLADLKANDKKSEAYQFLDDYSVWFVNWR